MKKFLPFALVLIFLLPASSCKMKSARHKKDHVHTHARPKLVIGIVVDQMRWDYLYRYSKKYSDNGFKRLLREGLSCQNTFINYSPSYTGPGHTCIYSGSVPSIHGITGNVWYDRSLKGTVYCVEDTTERTIGSSSSFGEKSPRRMLVTTITDELRLATNFKSKVIGIALKDRSAILPAGHAANAAYFFDGSVGKWVSSSYYMKELPKWVKHFNEKNLPEKYLSQNWNTLLPLSDYTESEKDDAPWERPYANEKEPVFEHKVSELMKSNFNIITVTPYGNTLTLDFAEDAITYENLGKGHHPDFLTISLSSTDLIGHQFGPNSIEVEDCYLRLDRDLGNFFGFLDNEVGKGNYLLFLTADHGAAHAPDFLEKSDIPGGVFPLDSIVRLVEATLEKKYGADKWILDFENTQFYLNNKLIAAKKINRADLKATIKDFMMQYDAIANVIDLENLPAENVASGFKNDIANGVYKKRSGDLFLLYNPGWLDRFSKGTTHGTVYPYDTHIPLVWMGWKVKHGEDFSEVHMTDIAPTLAAKLHIQEPNGCVGKAIKPLLKK